MKTTIPPEFAEVSHFLDVTGLWDGIMPMPEPHRTTFLNAIKEALDDVKAKASSGELRNMVDSMQITIDARAEQIREIEAERDGVQERYEVLIEKWNLTELARDAARAEVTRLTEKVDRYAEERDQAQRVAGGLAEKLVQVQYERVPAPKKRPRRKP